MVRSNPVIEQFDYVIVGAGSAGCVLARRLTELPECRVLLIESGIDIVPGSEPADVLNVFPLSTFNDAYTWHDLQVHWRRDGLSRATPFQQGRVMGGGSTVMGMWAVRGTPADYDGWQQAGALGWGWDEVLPYFRRIENDCDFSGPLHGNAGRIPVRRQSAEHWSPLARAMAEAAIQQGWPQIDDMNADFGDGHCLLPISRFEHSRASAGRCYLDATARARPNLTIWTETTVTRLRSSGQRIVGVSACRSDRSMVDVDAAETVVAAGAIYSPALLLRAGIGPARHLQEHGIEVLAARSGVGRNLQNHPFLPAVSILGSHAVQAGGATLPPAATYLRWSSGMADCPAADMGLYIRSYLVWHALGRRMAMLAPVMMKPFSSGSVQLHSVDPMQSPKVEFNFWSDTRDLPRMVQAFREAANWFETPQVRALGGAPFVLLDAGGLGRLNRFSRRNALQGWLGAKALAMAPGLTLAALRKIAEMRPLADFIRDDRALHDYVRDHAIGTNHVCGTCRMGERTDPLAVVDTNGVVIGVDGLRVVDASIMPGVPSGNTHMPTVMLAEKIADQMDAR
jgi:5-(hydroxymethyl)furfural/furfural oxidase